MLRSLAENSHLIERHLVAAPVIELRRPRAGVVGHGSGLFESTAILQICRDTSRLAIPAPE
jgi:hypothetical protein